jgi:hypothetical protein
MINIY